MLQALRYAVRQLRRSPGFAIIAVVTLTLGIAATTTVFSVLDAVLLEPLPFPHSDRLVAVTAQPFSYFSIPTALDLQQRSHSLVAIAAYRGWSPNVRTAKGKMNGQVLEVTQGFLSTLDASFFLGQDFLRTGSITECTAQAIVSAPYWKRLGGGNQLDGRTLDINGRTFQIAGVLSLNQPIEGPSPLDNPDILIPVACNPLQHPENRGNSSYQVIGRLTPGVSLAQANAEMVAVQRSLRKDYPKDYPAIYQPTLRPLKDMAAGEDTRSALYATLAACALLLLIACANLANLLLARNTRRRHEFATRATLGASLSQLLQQLLIESAVLAGLGAISGVALAAFALRLLRQLTVIHIPRLGHAAIHLTVLAFVVATFLFITVLLTLLPARRTLQPNLLRDLSVTGRATGDRSLRRAGRMLVVAQLTLTMVMVASAGWMVASVFVLLHQPLGFDPTHLLLAGVDLHGDGIVPTTGDAQTNQTFNQIADELRHLPGVEAVSAANHYPLGGYINRYDFCSDTHPEQCKQTNPHSPDSFNVLPGYFSTIGQTLYSGRDFTGSDDGRSHVVIVNHALAQQEWPGQSPIGKRLYTGQINDWATVVGVVADVHNFDLSTPPVPNLYLPEADHPQLEMTFTLRTSGDPEALTHEVREAIQKSHPNFAFTRLGSMQLYMARQVQQRRFLMWFAIAFGLLSLLIAVLGIYGLLAYEISLRQKEIGIRIALGSSREGVIAMLLRQEALDSSRCNCRSLLRHHHRLSASLAILRSSICIAAGPARLRSHAHHRSISSYYLPGPPRRAGQSCPCLTRRLKSYVAAT